MKSTKPVKFYNVIGPQVRKQRYVHDWSQTQLAAKLQCAGWDLPRGTLAKIEASIQFVHDFELLYLAQVLHVEVKDLFPSRYNGKLTCERLSRLMHRKRRPDRMVRDGVGFRVKKNAL